MAPNVASALNTMTVTTNAARTLIDWNSYTVAAGQTVNYVVASRSDIVLNRLTASSPVNIQGDINSYIGGAAGPTGGNIWFSAPGGIVFGPQASVNVGGLLATTSLVDVTSFLDTSKQQFAFQFPTGSNSPSTDAHSGPPTSDVPGGVGGITVQSGAQLHVAGGLLALIAPFVNNSGAARSDDGSVLYGAANAFTVTLQQEASGDLDLLQFVIDSPSTVTDTPLFLEGATNGRNVYLAALSASGITQAVVDATGTIQATQASAGVGGEVILTTASDLLTPGSTPVPAAASGPAPLLVLARVSADAQIDVVAPTGVVGGAVTLTAGGGLNVSGPISLTRSLEASSGGPLSLGDVSAQGYVHLVGASVSAGTVSAAATAGTIFDAFGYLSDAGGQFSSNRESGSLGVDIVANGAPGEPGTVSLNALASGGIASITAAGAVSISSPSQVQGAYIYSGGPIALEGALTSGGELDLEAIYAPGDIAATSLASAAEMTLVSPQGAIGVTQATTTGELYAKADGAVALGAASAGEGVNLTGSGVTLASLGGALAGDVVIDVTAGGLSFPGPLSAQRSVTIEATGSLSLGDVSAQGYVHLVGASVSAGTVSAAATAGTIFDAFGYLSDAGGQFSSNRESGSLGVDIVANGAPGEPGTVSLNALASGGIASITAAGAVSISSPSQVQGAYIYSGGPIALEGALTSGGELDLEAIYAPGDIAATSLASTAEMTLVSSQGAIGVTQATTSGEFYAKAGGAATIASVSTPAKASVSGAGVTLETAAVGEGLTIASAGDATLDLATVGGALSLDASGATSVGSLTVAGAARITAADLDIATLLSAPTLLIESSTGPLVVGGSAAPAVGMSVSAAEFSRIKASASLTFSAGAGGGASRGDLVISDLALDPAATPMISFLAAPGQAVQVVGSVTPTTSGGVVNIGSGATAWTPSTILISGSLGQATRIDDNHFAGAEVLDQLNLYATGNVLIGSTSFLNLIQATPGRQVNNFLGDERKSSLVGLDVDKVFIATNHLDVFTHGDVIQQNTSGSQASYAGLYLVSDLGGSSPALTLTSPGTIDLYGSYVTAAGQVDGGTPASRDAALSVFGLLSSQVVGNFHFNGERLFPAATAATLVRTAGQAQSSIFSTVHDIDATPERSGVAGLSFDDMAEDLTLDSTAETIAKSITHTVDELLEIQIEPVETGAGNEEIWRRSPGGAQASQTKICCMH